MSADTVYDNAQVPLILNIKDKNLTAHAHINITLKEYSKPYDNVGASYYIIAVMVVYGLAVVLLIAYISKRSIRAQTLEHDERQVSAYLQKVPDLKESNARQQFKELKSNIETLVNNKQNPDDVEETDVKNGNLVNITNIEGTDIIIDNTGFVPSRRISEVSQVSSRNISEVSEVYPNRSQKVSNVSYTLTNPSGYCIYPQNHQPDLENKPNKSGMTLIKEINCDSLGANQPMMIPMQEGNEQLSYIIHQPAVGHILYYKPKENIAQNNNQILLPVRTRVKALPVTAQQYVDKTDETLFQENQVFAKEKRYGFVQSKLDSIEEWTDENEISSGVDDETHRLLNSTHIEDQFPEYITRRSPDANLVIKLNLLQSSDDDYQPLVIKNVTPKDVLLSSEDDAQSSSSDLLRTHHSKQYKTPKKTKVENNFGNIEKKKFELGSVSSAYCIPSLGTALSTSRSMGDGKSEPNSNNASQNKPVKPCGELELTIPSNIHFVAGTAHSQISAGNSPLEEYPESAYKYQLQIQVHNRNIIGGINYSQTGINNNDTAGDNSTDYEPMDESLNESECIYCGNKSCSAACILSNDVPLSGSDSFSQYSD